MFRRELGLHFRWVWPLPLILFAAMSLDSWSPDEHLSLTNGSFKTAALFGFALFGAVLGFVQFFGHARGGARDVLLHRPTRRAPLFAGKVVAGLLLFAYGAGLPFAALVAWCAWSPRPWFPFGWELCVPGLVDLLGGALFYFAGSLVAQRDVRWHGGRLLPLAGAGAALLCGFVVPQAWLAVLVHVAAMVPLAIAARAAFVDGDALARPAGRLSLGGVLLAGIFLTGGAIMALVGQALYVDDARTSWCSVTKTGDLLRSEYRGRRGSPVEVFLLGGPSPTSERSLGQLSRRERDELLPPIRTLSLASWWRLAQRAWYRGNRVYSYAFSSHEARWFFDHRSRLLTGFDRDTGAFVGRLGPSERTDVGEPAPRPFEGALLMINGPLTTERAVYAIAPGEDSVDLIHAAPPGDTIRFFTWRTSGDGLLLVGDRLKWLDVEGKVLLDTAFAAERGRVQSVNVYDLSESGTAVVYLAKKRAGGTHDLVTWLDSEGNETARREVRVERDAPALTSTGNLLAGLLVPPAFRVAWPPFRLAAHLRAPGWFSAVEAGPLRQGAALFASLACGLVALVIAKRRGMRGRAIAAWSLAGLAFGPAGLVLMAVLEPMPVLEPCPCGARRRVDEDPCSSCGAGWPEPELDGTEIFA